MLRAVSLLMILTFSSELFAEEGCGEFAHKIARCQPYSCEEVNPLNAEDRISREIQGSKGGLCHYEESFEVIDEVARIDCQYSPGQQVEKAKKHLALLTGFFQGEALREDFFINDFKKSCQSSHPITKLLEGLSPDKGTVKWF